MSEPDNRMTEFGFRFGAADVTRLGDLGAGRVVVGVETPKTLLRIFVTKTGKVRVFQKDGHELKPVATDRGT